MSLRGRGLIIFCKSYSKIVFVFFEIVFQRLICYFWVYLVDFVRWGFGSFLYFLGFGLGYINRTGGVVVLDVFFIYLFLGLKGVIRFQLIVFVCIVFIRDFCVSFLKEKVIEKRDMVQGWFFCRFICGEVRVLFFVYVFFSLVEEITVEGRSVKQGFILWGRQVLDSIGG